MTSCIIYQMGMCSATGGLHDLCHELLLVLDKNHYFALLSQSLAMISNLPLPRQTGGAGVDYKGIVSTDVNRMIPVGFPNEGERRQ
jgi:hypothetical protein